MTNEIELVFEPKVYLVGVQTTDNTDIIEYLDDVNAAEEILEYSCSEGEFLVEIAGRLDYNSYEHPRPGGNSAYLKNVIERLHGSLTEMAQYAFVITGISRACSHELIRHRFFNVSQRSTRYCDESSARYIEPPEIAADDYLHAEFMQALIVCRQAYVNIFKRSYKIELVNYLASETKDTDYIPKTSYTLDELEKLIPVRTKTSLRKKCRGLARSVLPHALETKIFINANARILRNFFELRASRHADQEIRLLANKIYDKLLPIAKNLFGDYTKILLDDNTYELHTPNRKI